MTGSTSSTGRADGGNRLETSTGIWLLGVFLVATAMVAFGTVAVAGSPGTGTPAVDDGPASSAEDGNLAAPVTEPVATPGPAPVAAGLENNVSIPHEAYTDYDYGIVPEDTEVEVANDTVEVAITAQDLGGGEGDLTSFRYDVRYDPVLLDFTGNVDLVAGAISATEDERDSFDYEEKTPGVITIDWYVDIGLDDIIDQLFNDDGPDDPWPTFSDETLFTLEFEPSIFAQEGDTASIDVMADTTNHPDEDGPIVWSDMIDILGSGRYDSNNIWWGDGQVEVVPESLAPAIEGADGTFEARSTGGYIDFGQTQDPGENAQTLATFPGPADDEQIVIEGDYRLEDGKWRAEPDDVDFPEIAAGDSNAPARVLVDEPFEGTIDVENDTMTMSATITISVNVLDEDFWFEFDTTSGQSGELAGDASFEVDPDTLEGTGSTRLVDNEFVVLEGEQENVDELRDSANLERNGQWVADRPGENYLVYDFDLTFEEFVGEESTLTGSVVDEAGQPIDNASVDIVDSQGDDVVTAADGTYTLDGLDPGTWEVRVNAEGYEPVTETVTFEPLDTVERTVQLTPGETNFEVELQTETEVAVGDAVPVRATVENTDVGTGEQEIELTADGETVATETVELGEEIEDGVTPDRLDTSASVDFQWTPEEPGTVELAVSSDDDAAATDVDVVGEDDVEVDAIVDVEIQQGSYVAFNKETLADAEEGQILLPPQEAGDEAFTFRAEVVDGEWSAGPNDITFPSFNAIGYDANPAVPLGLEGEIDAENDHMTLEGGFEVDIPGVGAVLAFDTEATTGTSGAMSGSADIGEESGTATLVANEFVVGETGSDDIDSILEPPVPEGRNWLLLDVELDIQDVSDVDLSTGNVTGVVTDQDGEPVEGATVSVEGEPGDTTTNADGEYELPDVSTGEQTLVVTGDGFDEKTASVSVAEDETAELDVEVEGGEPAFEISLEDRSAIAGDTLELLGGIDNVGNAPGSVTATLSIGDRVTTETVVEPAAGESEAVTLEWGTTEADVGEYTATLELGEQTVEAAIIVEEPLDEDGGPDALIELENTGDGYISFDESSEADAREEGLDFPANEIVVEGEVYGDRWQATGVRFPTLDTGTASASVTAEDFQGTIDTETDTMTMTGGLSVDVIEFDGDPFEFSVDATTGTSGALEGSASLDADGGTVTLVDNQYTVTDETGSAADGVLGLPLTEPGSAWIELNFDVEIEELEGDGPATGALEGVVTDAEGDPIEGATVDVLDELSETTTAENGSFGFERLDTGSYEVAVSASGYEDATHTVEITEDETVDLPVELEAGEADLEYDLETSGGAAGETVTATVTIRNTGDGHASEDVVVSVGDAETEESVDLAPGEEKTLDAEWQTESDDTGTYAASLRVGDEEVAASDEIPVETQEEPESAVVIDGSGGFVAFSQDSESSARSEGLDLPAFTITAELDDETGAIEATADDVVFAEDLVEPQTGQPARITAPDGFTGTIDQETGEMELQGTLKADIYEIGESFAFEIHLTTGDSGAMSGEVAFDAEAESATLTLVDNEYEVEGTGNGAVDSVLGLPSESGESWIEFEATADLTTADEAEQKANNSRNQTNPGGEDPGDGDEDQEETTFLTSLGMLGGIVGVGAAITLVFVNVFGRFINAVDPDPGS